jgi:peptidoglycan hydrolase-like protein with peptidoglycan-binding domain
MADRTLKIHSKGELVKTLQAVLNIVSAPSPNLPLITTFGPQTQQAVIAFQLSHSLTRHDGTVDTETWHALRSELGDNLEMLNQFHRRSPGLLNGAKLQIPGWLAGISVPLHPAGRRFRIQSPHVRGNVR